MPSHSVEFAPSAYRQFAKLDASVRRRLAPAIEALAEDPRPGSAKRLVADDELWRIRVDAYRVVYAIEDERLVVLVVRVGHRRDVYRNR